MGSALLSVGEDEIQRNNQEIRKRKGRVRVINHRGHSRCPFMDLKKERGRMDIRSWPSSPVLAGFVTFPKGAPQFVY
jgi:ribosomal protein L36